LGVDSLIPVLVMAAIVGGIAATFIAASVFLGPKRRTPVKDMPFECGIASQGLAGRPVAVRFYLMAILFILFDVELAFLFPWAVVFRELGLFGFMEMFIFSLVVGVGFLYAWKIGALEWD
jgi:NADH-quinone oxidoreductase subunit A